MIESPASPLIDISRPLHPGIDVWPGDRAFELAWSGVRARGDPVNVAWVRLGLHTGTHLDAPYHVLEGGSRVDELPIDTFVGAATVLDARGREAIDHDFVYEALDLTSRAPSRLLFRTDAWAAGSGFPTTFTILDPEAASLLARSGVRLIGTDAPSVDPFGSTGLPAHHALLSAGVCILENLQLDGVAAGAYELIALPLRITGADASPVRAVLRPR